MFEDRELFSVETPLGFRVHCYEQYWQRKIVADHPIMEDRLGDVVSVLKEPGEIRRSKSDQDVYLFYNAVDNRLVCAVARQPGFDGFLITAYPTDKVKQGEVVWTK